MFFLLAGKAAGDTNSDKTALGLCVGDAVEPDYQIPASSYHWGLAPLRWLHHVNIEAASVAATAVIPDQTEVLNPGSEAGLSVDLPHNNAGLADSEGELGCHLGTDGPAFSAVNPLCYVLHDAHAAPP
ncbi:hypothetical protein ACTG2E_23020 [Aeromonas veronii]